MLIDKIEKILSFRQDIKILYYIKNENINIIRNDYCIIKKKRICRISCMYFVVKD